MTKSMLPVEQTRHSIDYVVFMTIFTKLLTSVASQPWIFPTGITAITLNSSLTMMCNYTGLANPEENFSIYWLKDNSAQGSTWYNCSKAEGQLDARVYNFTCPDLNLQSITIKRANLKLHNTTWKCAFVIPVGRSNRSKNEVTIIVNVPVTRAMVTNPSSNEISVMEGNTSAFLCETSACRPEATVLWFKKGVTSVEQVISDPTTVSYADTPDDLIITTSTMYYTVSRMDMNYNIYCKARNSDSDTVTSEHQPKINVLYSPVDGPIIQNYGGTNYSLMENATLILTCIITGGNPRPILTWTCNGGTTKNMSSGSNTTVRLTWKAERGTDGPCTCTSYHPVVPTNRSDVVNVVILYPPSAPVILLNGTPTNGPVKIVNNTNAPLNCSSSSNPSPTYAWQYRESQQSGSFVSLRVHESGVATCTASNTITVKPGETQAFSSNKTLILHSLYGPTQTNVFCLSGNTQQLIDDGSVNVIHGDDLTLTCSSNGNPQPEYTWNGQRGGNVTITIIQDNLIYNCTASNVLEPDYGSNINMMDSKEVRIIRQYAPETIPTITYTFADGQLSGTLISSFSVVENSSFVLTCENSSSVPTPMYQWTGEMDSTTGYLNVESIKRSTLIDANGTSYYEYTCKVHNSMTNTCGNKRIQKGTFDYTQRVNVLCAIILDTVPDQSIIEGEHLSLTARVIAPGSPWGSYKWLYRKTDTPITTEIAGSLSNTLYNISRSQAGFYTIVATNQIAPTDQMSYTISVNKTFYLNVFYTSTVSLFTINEKKGNCTVNEHTTVSFVCGVDSNPLSVVYIHATTYNGKSRLTEILTAKQVEHTIQIATCYDSGLYRCIGHNNYTSKPVSWDNRLFVRCTPRPRYDIEQNITFHKALGASVTLNLTLIAYPEPSAERFKWEKVDGENITELINSTQIQISTTGLATNLTIYSLKQTEFGQYRLLVNYTYIHYFYISPQDAPQMPTHVTHEVEHLTETSAVLKWRPGFDGGLPQTFYIVYKKQSDSTWSHTNVLGSMVTLSNLWPGTFYNVKMFASNSLGNSSETDVLNITTKSLADDLTVAFPSAAIVGAVGGVVALIIVVAVVVVLLMRRQKRDTHSETDGYEIPQSRTVSFENDNGYNTLNTVGQAQSDHNSYYNLERSPYEDLTCEREDTHEYGTLNISENITNLSTDKMYENLRLSPMKLK